MLGTLGIINGLLVTEHQRRQASRSLNGKPVLEWVARQMTDSCCLDGVIIVTDNSEENAFIQMLAPLDVPVFVARTNETLKALTESLETFPAETSVLIGMDWPLIDSMLVDRLIRAAKENSLCRYAAYRFECSCFAAGRPFGMFPEWYRSQALHEANRKATDPIHRKFPGLYFLESCPSDALERIPAPSELDREDIRLTVEDEEDWEHVVQIFDAMGSEDDTDWYRICELLIQQPELRSRMAHCNKIHPHFKTKVVKS